MPLKDTAPSRVHIYCRVSSQGQEDGYGLDVQEADCRQWCATHTLPVASCVHETWTGTDRHRPALDALIRRLEPGDVVLFHRASRLSRSGPLDTFLIKDRIQSAGASMRFVEGDVPDDETGELMLALQGWKEARDRDQIVRQTQAAMRRRAASGKPLAGRKPAYGYKWFDPDVKHGKSRLVLDPATAPVVRMVFDWALAGMSLRGIVMALAERGIPSPTGKPRWAVPTVRELLRRPTYTGTGVAYRHRHVRKPGGGYTVRESTADERIVLPDIAPPIVTVDEQAMVLAKLAHNQQYAPRHNKNPEATLLRAGFIRCGHCGNAMHAGWNPGSVPIYKCVRGTRARDACPYPTIVAKYVDPPVWDHVTAVLRDPDIIAHEVERRRDDGSLDRALAGIDHRLAALAQKQTNTARAIASINDEATAAPLLVELKMLGEQHAAATAERADLLRRMANHAADAAKLHGLADWCATVGANLDDLSYEEKRLALQALGVQVTVYRPGTMDDMGQSLRWELMMAPRTPTSDSIVFRSARGMSWQFCYRHD
jgi:site-specific DNA recombinase